MDERRAIPLEPEVVVTPPVPRRGMPIWLQLLICVVILLIGFAGWAYFYPGARDTLAGWGITLPGGAATGADASAQAAGASPGANPGGAPGGGNFRNGGGGQGGFPGRGANRAAVVVTAPVTSAIINDKLTAIGEGTAASSVTVISTAGGTLDKVLVTPGQVVQAGAELAELDSQSEQIALDRAQLAATDATSALTRATELKRSSSVSDVQLTAAQLANDQAQLELRNADLELQKRKITTPIAGTVGLLQVTPGNQVNAQTPITTVEDASAILINFWVPERYAAGITVGMPISAAAVAIPGKSFDGTVSAVDNRIDPTSRTLQVQARIPNPDGAMRPGMSFSVTLQFSGQTYSAVDPLSIQWSSDGAYVWKVVDGKVQKGMVQIVQRNSAGVLVTGDVALGDAVVTQGVLQLQDGAAVRLLDAPQGDQAADTTGGQAATPAAANGQATPPTANGQGGQPPAGATLPGQPADGAQPTQGQHRRNGQQGQNPAGDPAQGQAPATQPAPAAQTAQGQ